MGRKKKPFISKKDSRTYRLVQRSQEDPLNQDPREPQNVWHPAPSNAVGGEDVAREVKTEGAALEKIVPVVGPQPDWDPDIVAALDSLDVSSADQGEEEGEGEGEGNGEEGEVEGEGEEESDELEDDFVLKASGGEVGDPVFIGTKLDTGEGGQSLPWWQSRGDFVARAPDGEGASTSGSGSSSSSPLGLGCGGLSSDEEDDLASMDGARKRGASGSSVRFTEYSMSSSVVPRSEGLTLLDERFEKLMEEYDDSQIGALEEGDAETARDCNLLLEKAADDLQRYHMPKELSSDVGGVERRHVHMEECDEEDGSTSSGSEGEEGGCGFEYLQERKPRDQWDCESILSTYSTLYNHPAVIKEPSRLKCVRLSSKTGAPLEAVVPAGCCSHPPRPSANARCERVAPARHRGETPEERKSRKKIVKEQRKQCRAEKKLTKLVFKSEMLRLEKEHLAHTNASTIL